MDAISVAIVVTVLSLGSALVYLFKADYEGRHSSSQQQKPSPAGAKRSQPQRQPQHNARSQQTNVRLQTFRTVTGAEVSSPKQQQQQQVPAAEDTSVSNQAPGIASETTRQVVGRGSVDKSRSDQTTGQKQQQLLLNNNNNQSLTSDSAATSRQQHAIKKRELYPASLHRQSISEPPTTDPAIDELDYTVAFEAFNGFSSSNKLHNSNGLLADKTASPKTSAERRHSGPPRKRHNVDYITTTGIVTKDTYSSEKLFNLIAASNLSKEEIELAIETLLNKLDSGSHDNDWKPPKSDPLHKLRNQLRDNEAALIGALQNHELSQAQCSKLKLELKQQKSKLDQSREELERCRKELSVVKVALEQTRANTSRQQLLDDERSKAVVSLERIQGDLKKALANADIRQAELCNELEEKKLQIQKLELSDQGLNEKMQELEMKLRSSELQIEQIHSNKNQTDYETSEKISELESEQVCLTKALKDQSSRLNESLELNNHLQKSANELKAINGHLEEMLKRQKDEKVVSESMLRGNINELEQELRDMNGKLSKQKSELEEKNRKIQVLHDELAIVNDEKSKIEDGLNEFQVEFSKILNNIPGGVEVRPGNWVRRSLDSAEYLKKSLLSLMADKQKLANTVEQLSEEKSTLLSDVKTLSTRSNSPTNASSKVSSKDAEKVEERKLIDKKNLELENKQQDSIKKEDNGGDLSWELSRYQQQIKDLKLEKSKLEAQIKFGLDSLKMEQERVRKLEEELEEYGIQLKENS